MEIGIDLLMALLGCWRLQGWCIIGTGLCDGVASLWPVKRTVPADSTRETLMWAQQNRDGSFDVIFGAKQHPKYGCQK